MLLPPKLHKIEHGWNETATIPFFFGTNLIQYTPHIYSPVCTLLQSNIPQTYTLQSALYYNPIYTTHILSSLHFTTIQYTPHKYSPVCTLLQSNIHHTYNLQSALYYNPIYTTHILSSLHFTTIHYTPHKYSLVCTLLEFSFTLTFFVT